MKKLICALLSILMILSMLAFVGCDKKDDSKGDDTTDAKAETLKFGFGVYVGTPSATNATEEKDGQAKASITAAVVTLDADGKIVACALDTVENTVKYTADGKAVANDSFKTKYEAGKDYNMVAYGGAAKEWYEQADAFKGVVIGKTVAEVKALVADGNKGTDEVVKAGCTIMIHEFVNAIEKACKNADDSNVTANETLKLGLFTAQTCTDATEEKDGKNQVETTIFAAAFNADNKVVAAASDCVQIAYTFNEKGESTFDATKAVSTKKEQGDNYNMKTYGGAAKEWYEQAAAFDAACAGKTVAEIGGFVGSDNYGNADLKAAGCTILVDGFVKAAAKLG